MRSVYARQYVTICCSSSGAHPLILNGLTDLLVRPQTMGLEHSIQLVVWQAKATIFTLIINLNVTACACKRFKVLKGFFLIHVISHNNATPHNRQNLK